MNIRDVPTKELEADRDRRCFSIYSPTGRFYEGVRFGKMVTLGDEAKSEFEECFYWLTRIDSELLSRKRQIIPRPNFWLTVI